ncbi:MAG: hypothetical protein JWN01_90 [Patescibacteria group bacterium]|nr:hypothetical protein [Patescibacteria group bacterium]
MKYQRFLLILLALSLGIFVLYVVRVNHNVPELSRLVTLNTALYAGGALILLFAGHTLRAYKARKILARVKPSSLKVQLQTLLIGYLYNTVLPFRLGEIIRAHILGRSLKISASFLFSLIIFERSLDGMALGFAGIVTSLLIFSVNPAVGWAVIGLSALLFLVGLAFLVFVYLLYSQDPRLLRFWHSTTGLLNDRLKNSLRFKVWSAIYGLQKVLHRHSVRNYVLQTGGMWLLYLLAVVMLTFAFHYRSPVEHAIEAVIGFLGVSVPSGPAYLGSYQAVVNPLFQLLSPGEQSTLLMITTWFIISIPSSFVGLVLIVFHRGDYTRLAAAKGFKSMQNKLAREQDISQELAAFLDAFFSSNTLSHILHRLETKEDIKLIQYFKGGSDASTILVHQNNEYVVKKIIPAQYAHRLKAQHDWLKDHSHLDRVVKLTNERETKTFYSIDIEYYPDYIPFFDYIHSQDMVKSKEIHRGVFEFLFEHVYHPKPKATNEAALEAYIKSKLWSKLDQASKLNHELAALREYDTLVINGKEYQNIHQVMRKIRANKAAWHDLSTYRESLIHGDVTIDNILASPKDHTFKIIDPAPDQNEIAGPVFDFGRQYQSLGYGYEFLCRDDARTPAVGNTIRYEDSISASYRDLQDHFRSMAKNMLEPEEYRAMMFHTAILYSRVLAHRVHINPANVPKFYAVSVRAFNDFLAQYESALEEAAKPDAANA